MVHFASSRNVTWDYAPVGYWSHLEVNIGIIFACLPALRSLQLRMSPESRSVKNFSNASGPDRYSSNRGRTFPSIAKHGKHAQLMSLGLRNEATRSHNQKTGEEQFVQMGEYESQLGQGMSTPVGDNLYRGRNHTKVQCGSIYTKDDEMLQPTQATQGNSASVLRKNKPGSETEAGGWNQGIKVKKDYSVTVELNPNRASERFEMMGFYTER
jgi:hypothetical protein